ncbi:MAG: PEP-CTERM sorting domain-containing protein [Planctomycetota bacterium]
MKPKTTRMPSVAAALLAAGLPASATDVSPAPFLQWFESSYEVQRERTADLFMAGYGGVWVPPTGRADTGGLSVGYDVFDRFDLGTARSPTLYGSEQGLRNYVDITHRMGGSVYADLIWNHNGFSDTRNTGLVEAGGYPGFVFDFPGTAYGDFHPEMSVDADEQRGRLAGLIDIDQGLNIQLIRHPVEEGNPQNIPGGTVLNLPRASNAALYPDRDLGGRTVFDPARNQNVTIYDFNAADPLQGDAVPENATGVLIRNARWMIQDIGVDGFRVDAARHFPRWVLNFLDEATFLASRRTNLDGSPVHAFSFMEQGFGSPQFQQEFIRKDIDNDNLDRLGGNRDVLDFNFFGAVNGNLQENGLVNDWRNVVGASIDLNDDGLMNGSQGVKFVESHDDFGPGAMINVAHAYLLMLPGNANVYYNAQRNFHPDRDFPKPGRDDALGNFGDTRTELVELRNRFGRGNYLQRFLEKESLAFEREKSALTLLSNRNDAGFDARTIQTAFDPGTWLVEQTGNAANNADIPEFLEVQANGSVNARFLRNDGQDQGYLIYTVPTPVSANGIELIGDGVGATLAGATPPQFVGGETEEEAGEILRQNGNARLADLRVIDGETFTVRLATQAVTLDVPGIEGGVRDVHADGDHAVFRINGGIDANGNGAVDVVTPGDVAYGFENFLSTSNPGFDTATQTGGDGLYEQVVDATALPEGLNFLTVRAFRHRDTATGGDGGPAVFSEFREVLWVDLLPPEVRLETPEAFNDDGGFDFTFVNDDDTADSVHVFRNLGASVTDPQILSLVNAGNAASDFDGGVFGQAYGDVSNGNQAFTVVTFERTGNYSIQRFTGVEITDGLGAGFGDVNADGQIDAEDIDGSRTLEFFVNLRNRAFNAAADPNGDGLIDTRDLLALGEVFEGEGAEAGTTEAYLEALARRGDQTDDGLLTAEDIDALFANIGTADEDELWRGDLDVDGQVDLADVELLVQSFARTFVGDAQLDGVIDQADLNAVLNGWGNTGVGWADGDFNGNNRIEQGDLNAVLNNWGSRFAPSFAANPSVPEPGVAALLGGGIGLLLRRRR